MADIKQVGTVFILTLSDGVVDIDFACSATDGFDAQSDTVEGDCKSDGIYGNQIPVKINTTITQDGLLTIDDVNQQWVTEQLHTWQKDGINALLDFEWGPTELGEKRIVGKAYITGVPITAPNKELATYSITLQVIGQWDYVVNA